MDSNQVEIKKKSLFSLTWPIFIEILLQMLLGNADTLMLSQYSDSSVAAVGVSNQVLFMLIVLYGILSNGSAILVAQYLGAKRKDRVQEVVIIAFIINLLIGFILSVGLYVFGINILQLMNIPPEILDVAVIYMQIVGGFSFIQALLMTAIAVVRGHGMMKISMYVTIGSNIINVIGNYMFIFGPFGIPALGAKGVAISTTFSRFIALIVMLYIINTKLELKTSFRNMNKYPKDTIKKLLKIGIPTAGEQLSYNTSQIVITSFISMLGAQALTTRVYVQNIIMFIFLFAAAIGQGTQILIGHLIGAGKKDEAYKICLKSLRIAMVMVIIVTTLFFVLRKSLMGIFTDNPSIINTGSTLIALAFIIEPGRTFNLVVINSLRAAGDVKFPVYMGILSMWGISVVLSYILGIYFELGLVGIWISFAVDEWLRGVLMLWRWRTRVWEDMSFVADEEIVSVEN
ncbi:MATE family efflux transporter [Caldisalinibacter kiritimatiensis]|uniref:Multi antimicrobial extrusion protein (Na(+)/drug antiporter) n=1 Tax=Caldisalinibacter kiritimatiensis TaxID=1304284 RepID=R1CE77_9FIRM|nr:MATE family efflux transporter [Caldisalinibacter kiritimatiensis]EOD00595.1 Multi antimicrobial extrusion protein (Na(+)/drug antiporter) [Caldisalinibacter kiritimatiensis]